jgi:hypothetical protein
MMTYPEASQIINDVTEGDIDHPPEVIDQAVECVFKAMIESLFAKQ